MPYRLLSTPIATKDLDEATLLLLRASFSDQNQQGHRLTFTTSKKDTETAIENASKAWPEHDGVNTFRVARLHIPQQDFTADHQDALCERP